MISGDVAVPQGRTVGEVVVFSGSAMVLGVVQGDVIVVDGPVTIAGQVSGDVVALNGRLRLQATAQVAGDVIAGDEVEVAEGAQVAGAVTENVRLSLSGTVEVLGALLASISMAISSLVLMLVMLLLVPRGIERLGGAARTAPLASAGWGVLVAIVLPTVAVVLVATILGLPLGLAVLLGLALVFLWAWRRRNGRSGVSSCRRPVRGWPRCSPGGDRCGRRPRADRERRGGASARCSGSARSSWRPGAPAARASTGSAACHPRQLRRGLR